MVLVVVGFVLLLSMMLSSSHVAKQFADAKGCLQEAL